MNIKKLLDEAMLPWTHERHDDGRRAITASDDSGVYLHGSAWSVSDDDLDLIVESVNAMPKMVELLGQAETMLDAYDQFVYESHIDRKPPSLPEGLGGRRRKWCADVSALVGDADG